MFHRLAKLVLFLKWPVLLALLIVTIITGRALLHLQIDPSIDPLFIKKSEEYKTYRKFSRQFGSDQMIAVAMATQDLFTAQNLQELEIITKVLSEFEQVERVVSLASAMDIKHKFLGVKIVPVLEEVYKGERAPEDIRDEVLANELFRNNLVSADGRVANILIYLKPTSKDRASNGLFIKELRKFLASRQKGELKFYIAGSPVEQYDFIRFIRRDQVVFVPMITILLILTTWLIYRSFACVVMTMSIVFLTLIWSLGTIALVGSELNLVTSLLAPVIMIVAVVNAIHLMNLFFEIRPHHPLLENAVVLTMGQLGSPCLLTHLTTILGFASLALNPIPAIKMFGIFAALGTFYSYLIEILLTPILFPILPSRPARTDFDQSHFFNRFLVGFLEKLEFRWKWWILGVTAVLIVVSIFGMRKIEVDTNMIKQMKKDSLLSISTRFIDNNLTGVYVLGFVINKKDGSAFLDHKSLKKIEKLKNYLESQPEIVKVNSLTTLIKKIHFARTDGEVYAIPEDQGQLETYFEGIAESKNPEIWKLTSPDFKQIQLEARMKAVGTKEGDRLEQRLRTYLDREMSGDFDSHLTGNIVLLGKTAKNLVHYQMKGFGLAFVSILIAIAVIFRSIKLGLLAAIPNIFPIIAVYGLMGYLGIELSSATAMISSIVLGMVVDASIHFIHRFRLEFSHRQHYIQALHHTYRNVGQSLVVSTLILVAGFASSIFASFRPTIYLGVLTSLTILIALVCALVILPVCLIMLKPFGPERLFRRSSHVDTPMRL